METGAADELTLEGLIHDLNNIFQTISEAAGLIEQDPKWSPVAALIHRSVDRGRGIAGSLSAGALAPPEFDSVVDNAIGFARDLLEAVHAPPVKFMRDVELGIRLKGGSPAWERVLVNLFVNAAQAMEGGGEVEISARRGERGIEIRVSDNGPGIRDEILPRIFTPHFSTKSSSSGLGLHIVKSIVTQNGGSVAASNRTGAPGAEFFIEIPAG